MNVQALALLASFMIGCLLGGVFFGGLWWTVRRLPEARHPARLMMLSAVIRTAVVVGGIGLVMDGRWQRAAACLVGFVLVRTLATWLTSASPSPGSDALPTGGRPWS